MSNYLNYNYMKQTTGKDKNNDSDLDCKFNQQTHYKIESSNEDRKIIGPSMLNHFGDQNCFLNVLIHAIYSIKEIRNFFLEEEFRKDSRLNVFSELQYIIEKYSKIMSKCYKSNDITIDPNELRKEIAELFQEERKFQLNKMNDPIDLFQFLLNSFHSYSTNAKSLKYEIDKACNPQCLSHKAFWINLLEQFQCRCGATSEVLQYDYNYFMYEVYVIEIMEIAQKKKEYIKSFFKFMKENNGKTTLSCPEKCRLNQVKRNFFLLSNPSYMCFNLIWSGKNPLLVDIFKLLAMLPERFNNNELFNITEKNQSKTFELFGLVCYWGAHYICFFKNDEGKTSWIYYDDTVVNKIETWKDVILKCLKSHFHPTILFYRLIDEIDSNRYYYRNKVDDSIVFSDQEFYNIIEYCKNIDEINERKSDYLKANEGKESIATSKIRSSDLERIREYKELNKTDIVYDMEEYNEDNWKKLDDTNKIKKYENDIPIIESNDVYNISNKIKYDTLMNKNQEKKEILSNKLEIKPAEDEWICQNEKCNNINKLESYKCLKCRTSNENIYLLNLQKSQYETDLKKSLNRRSSLDPKMMQRYSSISKSQFSLLNYDDNHLKAKNVGIINKDISQSLVPSENTTIVCTICKTVNSNQERKCGYCDNTLLKIDKNSSNNSYTNIKDKYIIAKLDKNASNDDKYLQNFNSNLNLNKHQMNNLTRSSYLNQKEPWYCAYCRHLNKHVQNLCGKCHRDRTILNHNNIVKNGVDSMHNMNRGLNTNIENRFGISSTTNNNDLSSTKRGVTPVKKIDNVRFKDSTTEIGKRSLNNDSNGPIQNIERIFNRNPQTTSDYNYKPLINKDSNKKNIIVSNYNPNNMVKNPPLEIQRKYNNNYSNIFKKN